MRSQGHAVGFLSKGQRVFGDLGYLGKLPMGEENAGTSEQAGGRCDGLSEPQ